MTIYIYCAESNLSIIAFCLLILYYSIWNPWPNGDVESSKLYFQQQIELEMPQNT